MDEAQTSSQSCPLTRSKEEDQIVKKAVCYSVPTHLAHHQQPWKQIYGQETLSSVRRQTFYFDPKVPRDDLDFVIQSDYDHQKDLFKTKQEVLYQPHVYDMDDGLVLKNRIKSIPHRTMPLNHPLIVATQKEMEDLHRVNITPGGLHVHATRCGYSRKPNIGGFFLS